MTADYIARICENKLKGADINSKDVDIFRNYFRACGLLEDHIRHNFDTFVETELVYRFANLMCKKRNTLYNLYRAYGGGYSFKEWLIKKGYYNFRKDRFIG